MGIVNHRVLVVVGPYYRRSSGDKHGIVAAHAAALEESGARASLVSPIIDGAVNDVGTFIVATSGSKVGWDEALMAEETHDRIIARLEAMRYSDGSSACNWFVAERGEESGRWWFENTDADGRRR